MQEAAIGCVPRKERLAQALVQKLTHFRAKRQELESRPEVIWEILREGRSRAPGGLRDVGGRQEGHAIGIWNLCYLRPAL